MPTPDYQLFFQVKSSLFPFWDTWANYFFFPIRLLLSRSPENFNWRRGNTNHTLLFVKHLYASYVCHILLMLWLQTTSKAQYLMTGIFRGELQLSLTCLLHSGILAGGAVPNWEKEPWTNDVPAFKTSAQKWHILLLRTFL